LALPDRPSLAVLPFQNVSGDPEQEYFADGMVEEGIQMARRARQPLAQALHGVGEGDDAERHPPSPTENAPNRMHARIALSVLRGRG
jgi:hypothetical protein